MFVLAAAAAQPEAAERIYVNATILTMDAAGSTAEAFAVSRGRFIAVGTNQQVRRLANAKTAVVDLGGRTVLPGLYAAHGHFPQAGVVALTEVDLNSPPMGLMESVGDIVEALRRRAAETPPGQWIAGRGYDDTLIRERRHPNRHDLDRASTVHPIVIVHTSGHLSVANSRALAIAGVTRDTPQPAGGAIRKHPATGEPDGVIEESGIVRRHVPEPAEKEMMRAIRLAGRMYVSKGVTTAVPAGGNPAGIRRLAKALSEGNLPLRITSMMGVGSRETIKGDTVPGAPPERLRIGAAKLWYDGSIQGYTGYLSRPYHRPRDGDRDYRGYALMSRQQLVAAVTRYHRLGIQVAVHGNGDAAIDDILDAFEQAQRKLPRADARHRIEHCQTAREDQLDRMRSLGVTPSFFVGHVYYWGDRHRDIFLGPDRAARISPLASALKRGLRFTLHDDTPVTPVNPLQLVWAAANRLTRDGLVLGAEQKIPVLEALRSVTSGAAWQNFEEAHKGSIEPGKLADFVVLDRNPLKLTAAEQIRDLRVLETFVGGASVYRFENQDAARPPYPPSPVIAAVSFDWSTHRRDAMGSDNWQLTWADDDHQYAAWGDGGGFGGTNSDGRASLGVARVEGSWRDYRGVNVWGGKNALHPADVDGKSWGMISVRGTLYMWVVPGSPLNVMQREARLYRSPDHGATWEAAGWSFSRADELAIPTICQFGKDYAGARDAYVYHYFSHPREGVSGSVQRPGTVYLARSPADRVWERPAYEFFAGLRDGSPVWSARTADRKPVFEDRHNGVGWVLSVSYNPGLKRYLLMTDHTVADRGNLGIFDAPEPWGPWTVALWLNESEGNPFGAGHVPANTFFWNLPTKWLNPDGASFTMVFTGAGRGANNDSFNLIRGRFELRR